MSEKQRFTSFQELYEVKEKRKAKKLPKFSVALEVYIPLLYEIFTGEDSRHKVISLIYDYFDDLGIADIFTNSIVLSPSGRVKQSGIPTYFKDKSREFKSKLYQASQSSLHLIGISGYYVSPIRIDEINLLHPIFLRATNYVRSQTLIDEKKKKDLENLFDQKLKEKTKERLEEEYNEYKSKKITIKAQT